MLVLHYTGMQSAAAAIDRLCDPRRGSARIMSSRRTARSGGWCRRRGAHFMPGVSCWQGETDLNFVSIGVEIVNPGHEWGYRPFPEAQMAAVEDLCRDIARPATRSRRIVWSAIPTSRPTARPIPASSSTGRASPAPG